jgi:rod shape-determining protein MreD
MIGLAGTGATLKRPASRRRIVSSYLIALVIMMLPWQGYALFLRPDLVALLILYWSLREPRRMGGWGPFVMGLLVDVADGTTLGLHSLSYSIIFFLANSFRVRILSFYTLHQTVQIFSLLLTEHLLNLAVVWFLKQGLPQWFWLLQVPITALLWPLLPRLLERDGAASLTKSS